MNKKQILVVVGFLCFITGFILFTPPGVVFVVLMWILIGDIILSFLQETFFTLMIAAIFSMVVIIYLILRNLRIANSRQP